MSLVNYNEVKCIDISLDFNEFHLKYSAMYCGVVQFNIVYNLFYSDKNNEMINI